MYNCKECDQSFEHIRGFKLHLKCVHNTCVKDYTIKYQYDGVHPTCSCGCGQNVAWRQDSYFQTLVRGHYTQELKDAQAFRRLGKKTSVETKLKQSKSLKKLFESDQGIKIKQSRAENLRKFHASDDGKLWALQRSTNLKEFNKSEQGKQSRKNAGRSVSIWRKNHPEKMKEMSQKIKLFYESEQGIKWRKNKQVNIEIAKERLNVISDVFNILDDINQIYSGIKTTLLNVECKSCKFKSPRTMLSLISTPRCFSCSPFPDVTKPQREIGEYVQGLNKSVEFNDWKQLGNLELDVWVPEHNFAIEFNGLYWHSELNRKYHRHVYYKHEKAIKNNIKLLTIFEDEWRDKKEIVKSMIRSRLGLIHNKLGARNCKVIELNSKTRQLFFNDNHLEGDVRALISFGLEYDNIIVAAISLRKPFHKSSDTLEIARFATLKNYSVAGALSKLIKPTLKYASINNYKKIITYVDSRVGAGSSYVLAGMTNTRLTGPRFWWTDLTNRYDRFTYRAKNGVSQKDVAMNAGVVKIWGAGNYVFELTV